MKCKRRRLLVALGVGVLAVALAAGVFVLLRPDPIRERYSCIREGMTLAEVEAIMAPYRRGWQGKIDPQVGEELITWGGCDLSHARETRALSGLASWKALGLPGGLLEKQRRLSFNNG